MIGAIKSFLLKCGRVWKVLRKPSYDEIKSISKISALGLLLVGLIGFLISVVMNAF